jgi:long-chain fatty acid transport protein
MMKPAITPETARRTPFQTRWLGWASVLAGLLGLTAHGEGFRNPPPGTFNLGRSGGRIAHVDDASAIHQNPANLINLTNVQFQFTPSIVYIQAEYESPSGVTAETTDPVKVLPNLFAAAPVFQGRAVVGLGLTVPYGLSNEWEKDGSYADPFGLRYQAPWYSEMKTINVNPGISFRLTDTLSLGGGLNGMWSEVTLKQFYPWLIFPGSVGTEPDGNVEAQGDGLGYGVNLGLTWEPVAGHRFALTYRSPVTVEYDGRFTIDNITPTAAFLGVTSSSDFGTEIKFPTIIGAGYGVQVTEKLRLEVNAEWLEFSRFDSLDLDAGNNNLLLPTTSIPQNWRNTYTIGIGGDYQLSPGWIVRFGYQYYQSPVPDETLSPTIPDADQNVFTIGLGYRKGRHSLELGYGLDFYDDRTVTANPNPALNGSYEFNVHLFSAAYHLKF